MKYFLFAVIAALILYCANFELWQSFKSAPPGTVYKGALGFYFDYYQYLSFIRDGTEGRILISSHYIPFVEKGVLIHPLFPLLGLISKPLTADTAVIYHFWRNIFLLFYLYILYRFTTHYFSKKKYGYFALILAVFSSSFPVIARTGGGLGVLPLIPFWKVYYTFEKFTLPPHHLLADALFMVLLVLILKMSEKQPGIGMLTLTGLLSLIIFFLNPSTAALAGAVCAIALILAKISGKILNGKTLIIIPVIFIFLIFPVLYYSMIFKYGDPWRFYYEGERTGRYFVTFTAYILTLGPLFFTSLFSLALFKKFRIREIFMAVWMILPVLVFPFAGKQIPVAMSRILSINSALPMAILTVFLFKNLSAKRRNLKVITVLFLTVSLFSGLLFSLKDTFIFNFQNYYNVNLPDDLVKSINYMEKNRKGRSTVVAGENISNLIPAFSGFQVVNGRRDAYPDYTVKLDEVNDIYFRRVSDEAIRLRLMQWNVRYLLFGMDHVSYSEFIKNGPVSGIDPVYSSGTITIAGMK